MILLRPYNTILYNKRLNRTVQDNLELYRIERAPANKVIFAVGPPANNFLFGGALFILYNFKLSCTVLFSLLFYSMVLYGLKSIILLYYGIVLFGSVLSCKILYSLLWFCMVYKVLPGPV